MKSVGIVGAAVACFLVAAAVSAQSLGDVAKQEAERRKNIKTAGKVYTNDSVIPDSSSAAPATAPPAEPKTPAAEPKTPAAEPKTPAPDAPAGTTPAQAGATAKPDDPKTEAYWKKRITAARESLARAQTFAEALQSRINVLSADFVNHDDPAQRNVIGADRQKATDELTRVKGEITQYQKAITDIQDEARRANVPPGWVR